MKRSGTQVAVCALQTGSPLQGFLFPPFQPPMSHFLHLIPHSQNAVHDIQFVIHVHDSVATCLKLIKRFVCQRIGK